MLNPREYRAVMDRLALIIYMHGPGPRAAEEVDDLTTAVTIHELATGLGNDEFRSQIQALAAKAIGRSAGALTQR
jgi:hypothetical protein